MINIFGHTPNENIQKIHGKHLNIDTGCVFGGKLTAIDLEVYDINSNEGIYQV